MSQTKEDGNGLRCLSFDGGGLKAICQALTVREMLHRLQTDRQLDRPPKAAEYFDIICGSGFGGLLAIMCGVLHLTGDELVNEFVALCSAVFDPNLDIAKRTSKLEEEVKRIVVKYSPAEEGGEYRKMVCDMAACKTFVCAVPSSNVTYPRLFRNYRSRLNASPDCSLWEAGQATTAVPELFSSISIGSEHIRENFVAGDLRWNNPTDILTREVENVFKGRHITCIVSIGSGHPGHLSLSHGLEDLFSRIAQDCEQLADDMERRFEHASDVYRRFSVDQGLQDLPIELSNLHAVVSHTHSYLQGSQTSRHIDALLVDLIQRPPRLFVGDISGTVRPTSSAVHAKSCPPPTEYFTGRQGQLDTMDEYYSAETESCHIGVLYGIGGGGKSQIGFKFIQRSQKRKRFTDIFFIDASNKTTLENGLQSIASGTTSKPSADDALRILSDRKDEWLLFLDNADDPTLNLYPYISWSHGNILITTRNRELRTHSPNCALLVDRLDLDDARQLLLKGISAVDGPETHDASTKLAEMLGCLALAISQARAYLAKGICSIGQYVTLYEQNRQKLLEYRNVQSTDDYRYIVYTTWKISFDKLSNSASFLFSLLCYMHHKNIPSSLFKTVYHSTYPYLGVDIVSSGLTEFLPSSDMTEFDWDFRFRELIGELQSFSLIDFNLENDTISFHPLVQQWAHVFFESDVTVLRSTQTILSLAVPDGETKEEWMQRRSLLDHFLVSLKHQIHLHHVRLYPVARIYLEKGVFLECQRITEKLVTEAKQQVGAEHPYTVSCMGKLAGAYSGLGRFVEARYLQEECLEILKRTSGIEDPTAIFIMGDLAATFIHLGQYSDACKLLTEVLEVRKRVLGSEHRETLWTISTLSATYSYLGRHHEALSLNEQVLELRKRTLGLEHPETLTSMSDLAVAYSHLGRDREAAVLMGRVVEMRGRIFSAGDPLTLWSLRALATILSNLGQHDPSLRIGGNTLAMTKMVLGGEHPDTLDSMHGVAHSYSKLGRHEDALKLQEEVVELRQRILNPDHPKTLSSQASLGITYSNLKWHDKALPLKLHVLELRKQKLGAEHPRTVDSMEHLAKTFSDLGRHGEALELQGKALELRNRTFGVEHPATVAGQARYKAFQKRAQEKAWERRRRGLIWFFGIACLSIFVAYLASTVM
ncbi:hypothetical protein DL96DRAFT_352619 [Flagelloscypha sp. PMI_526]|nr:hypothetical protein DL96DRAFT_352619 [Flagelloscypha sp. PMI_526]